ncbi:MAG: hypothetical protein OJI67_05810, partial [Prosthecobacter sp.]|nr:hypothetical protein [Prosthecobacter sp.]
PYWERRRLVGPVRPSQARPPRSVLVNSASLEIHPTRTLRAKVPTSLPPKVGQLGSNWHSHAPECSSIPELPNPYWERRRLVGFVRPNQARPPQISHRRVKKTAEKTFSKGFLCGLLISCGATDLPPK